MQLILSAALSILSAGVHDNLMEHFSGVGMKHYGLIALTLIFLAALIFTGFQCGSAESTSAKLYMSRKEWASAEKALMKEVEKNPNNAEALYLLGDVRREQGDYKGMLSAFEPALKVIKQTKTGQEWEQKIIDAKKYVWGQLLNKGVSLYNRSTSAPKDSTSVLRQSAIEAYQTALLINPDSAITYQNMAIAHLAMGNTDEEIKYLRMALERKSDMQFSTYLINAYVAKAENAKKANNKQEADANFTNAIAALTDARNNDPTNHELLSTLINVYIEAGRASDALPFIKEALVNDPYNKVFQNDLGLLLMQMNDLAGAAEHFSAAVAIDSTFTDALRNGAIALMKLGQNMKDAAAEKADPDKGVTDKSYKAKFKTAATLLVKYLSIRPNDADVWQALATAYGGADNTKAALEALKKGDFLQKLHQGMDKSEVEKNFGKPDKTGETVYQNVNSTLLHYGRIGIDVYISNSLVIGWTIVK